MRTFDAHWPRLERDSMKIVVYGTSRRVGALVGDRVIDLNRAFARYLHERRDATDPQAQADERTPYDLEGFITRGTAALDDAREALAHVQRNGATTHESQPRIGKAPRANSAST